MIVISATCAGGVVALAGCLVVGSFLVQTHIGTAPLVLLVVLTAVVVAGVRILRSSSRVLIDEALPDEELAAISEEVRGFGAGGVAGFHKLRARRAGARRYVDLHVQFRAGTTLEAAHATSHELQDAIRHRLVGADVLIHLEPEDRVVPGTEVPETAPRG